MLGRHGLQSLLVFVEAMPTQQWVPFHIVLSRYMVKHYKRYLTVRVIKTRYKLCAQLRGRSLGQLLMGLLVMGFSVTYTAFNDLQFGQVLVIYTTHAMKCS